MISSEHSKKCSEVLRASKTQVASGTFTAPVKCLLPIEKQLSDQGLWEVIPNMKHISYVIT